MRFGTVEITPPLISLSVFVTILVFKHTEIALVSTRCDVVVLDGGQNGASRFMGMGAVAEPATFRKLENLLEVAGQLLRFHVKRSEPLYSRRVYQVAAFGQFQHFAERSGVHARVVGVADFRRPQVGVGQNPVDQGRLAHAAVATEQRYLVLQQGDELPYALSCGGGDFMTRIADGLIERHHHAFVMQFVLRQQVGLVENEDNRHAIGLGRSQKTVNKDGACLRMVDRHEEESLVDIRSKDMTLFAQVLRFADNIVAAVFNRRDESRSFLVCNKFNPVTYGDRVGAPDSLQAKVTLYFAFYHLPVVGLH